MRRVNLLPPEDRRSRTVGLPGGLVGLFLVAAAALLVALAVVYLVFLLRLNGLEEEVAELDGQISQQNARLQELAPYRDLQARLEEKKPVADGIFRTRFPWDEFLQGLAFVVPETTALDTLVAEAATTDIEAPAEQPLDPPGAVTFTGVALPEYQNVADFVVQIDTLEFVANSQLNTAELKGLSQPAIGFEVASEVVTIVGENGTEVRIEGGSQDEVVGGVVGPGASSDLDEVADVSAAARDQYAAEAGSVRP
ncbi:MAG: Type IV pilus biogenesis protein PilN [uncultured Rubrobacteraceae bacterium]|uniref:Type IV pilus biogenesis protein PilN n=1 Tax=uncultured Rubrobacteraceae bacterium TaxID=349277 RepID=A0A6J4RQT6_9ACTN|nr:MAG: Type IV pilus biogenesis protein PilN [uncultured Rubrobacteraceae bacterium]